MRALAALLAVAAAAGPLPAQVEGLTVEPRLARLIPPAPTPAGYIADVPRLLDAAARERLDSRIEAISDSGLADIAVAILPTIGDYEAYEVGVGIYRTWTVGRQDSIGSARRDLGAL